MIYYLPLEQYRERYTLQLRDWTTTAFARLGVPHCVIEGQSLDRDVIETGVVLDAHGRSHYALTQTAALVAALAGGEITSEDVLYIDDMFHPGWEALPYIFAQQEEWPRVYTRCYAQSVDPNDFTFPMRPWMRHYEHMVDRTCDGIFLASSCQVDMLRTALFTAPLHVVGLPFDADEVRRRAGDIPPLEGRTKRIVYTSRWDGEKQPHFWMDLVEYMRGRNMLPDYDFEVCTGAKRLRSNQRGVVERAYDMGQRGLLTIHEGLSKEDYYAVLKNSRAQFNCALQDFVSYTLLEASSLGTPSLLPAHLSFPEAVDNHAAQLYVPWSIEDAARRLVALVDDPPPPHVVAMPSRQHSETFRQMISIMQEE